MAGNWGWQGTGVGSPWPTAREDQGCQFNDRKNRIIVNTGEMVVALPLVSLEMSFWRLSMGMQPERVLKKRNQLGQVQILPSRIQELAHTFSRCPVMGDLLCSSS